jgi:competence protein ComEA
VRTEPERVAERVRRLLEESGRAPTAGSEAPARHPAPPDRPPLRERLAARLPVRVDPGRRGALAVGVAVVIAAALAVAWVSAARPKALPVSSAGPGTGTASPSLPGSAAPVPSTAGAARPAGPAGPSAAGPGSSAPAPVVVVDVAGKVRHPGVYRLPAGARVDDAVQAAGGALSGARLDRLNLAAKLVDGQQVAVGVAPALDAGGGPPATAGGSASPGAPVDLNTGTLEQLQTLPGVGPVLAQHILDWRAQHGRFASVEQLNDVTGIGDVKFAALKSLVTV